jgi:hypothetical protein
LRYVEEGKAEESDEGGRRERKRGEERRGEVRKGWTIAYSPSR